VVILTRSWIIFYLMESAVKIQLYSYFWESVWSFFNNPRQYTEKRVSNSIVLYNNSDYNLDQMSTVVDPLEYLVLYNRNRRVYLSLSPLFMFVQVYVILLGFRHTFNIVYNVRALLIPMLMYCIITINSLCFNYSFTT